MNETSEAGVVQAGVDELQERLRTQMPGKVVKVDAALRRVDVELVFVDIYETEEGELKTHKHPVLPHVPLGLLRAGNARIEVPVAVGDWVTCYFCEWNIGEWLASGQTGISAGDIERHGLTGAIAVPQLHPDTSPLTRPLSSTSIVIGFDGGVELHVTPSQVRLGAAAASDPVITLSKLRAAIAALLAAGVGATGTDAFEAALTAWEAAVPPAPMNSGSLVVMAQ